MVVLGKGRMIRHRISQAELAKLPVSQIDMHLFAKSPLGPDAHAIAKQKHTCAIWRDCAASSMSVTCDNSGVILPVRPS